MRSFLPLRFVEYTEPAKSVTNIRLPGVERDADAFHQVGDDDLGRRLFVDRGPIDGVAVRRVATVGPVEVVVCVDFEVDRLRQALEHHLDVAAVGRGLACGKSIPARRIRPSPASRGLSRPVDLPAGVDGDADAPLRLVAAVLVAVSGLHQDLDVGAVEVARITRMPSRSHQ